MRVVCAMSGGVDSSVAAATLIDQGHEVIGMTMRLYDADPHAPRGRGGTCCSPAEVDQARTVCALLGIPHYTVDERTRFRAEVIDDFVRHYASGRTPNPCSRCNQHVKFGPLLERARALGAVALATGHYARNEGGSLLRACDRTKDQSYFLFAMGAEALARVWFPLGEAHKGQVRDRARALGLPNWDAPDSQELCFVPDGDHGAVVERLAPDLGLDAERLAVGPIEDGEGRVVGRHAGIHRVTVGQRRGLGVAADAPRYVLQVIPQRRAVVIGAREDLDVTELEVAELQRLAIGSGRTRVDVQIRHRSPARAATVEVDGDRAHVGFDAPVRGVAPGQAAVFYAGDQVLGGGWIS